ncbi:uncharacterized protein [Maniola hyperantus]|uniref:uncharacterized protein n=1 Tax=Aphantopus hyperantus TaxID=2795564 RepID=UPI0037489417
MRSENVFPNTSLASENITNILKTKVLVSTTDENDINDLYYNNTNLSEEDYVDFSLLHPDRAQDLYKIAKKKNLMAEIEFNKTVGRQARQSGRLPKEEAYWQNPFFVSKAIDLMAQSVYATRIRLRETRELRKKLASLTEYRIALMYGSLMQLRIKMDNLYTTMKKFVPKNTKFMWYLVLYERCLSFNVDISQMVKDMFQLETDLQAGAIEPEFPDPRGPPHGPPT